MSITILTRNIFVPVKECGSVIIRDIKDKVKIVSRDKIETNLVLDWNLCFYTCLIQHLINKMIPDFWRKLSIKYTPNTTPSHILIKFKEYLTSSLPYANIFTGKDDPSLTGSACDHRVIQKASTVFRITIYILDSGNKIYCFNPQYTESSSTMCLFFNNFHYQLVENETYKEHVKVLYEFPKKVNELYKTHNTYTNQAYTTVVIRCTKK